MTIHKLLMLGGGRPAPIDHVGTETGSASGSTSLTINKPAGTVEGTHLTFFGIADNNGEWSAPAGWECRRSFDNVTGSPALFTKVAGASEGSSYTFTAPGTTSRGFISADNNAAFGWCADDVVSASASPAAPGMRIPYSGGTSFAVFSSTGAGTWTTPTGYSAVVSDSAGPSFALFSKGVVGVQAAATVSSTISAGTGTGFQFFLYPSGFRIDEPEYVGSSTNFVTSTGTLPLTVPAEATTGRLMVAVMCSDISVGAAGWDDHADWSKVVNQASSTTGLGVFVRYATSEPASYSFVTSATSSGDRSGGIFVFDHAGYDTVGSIGTSTDVANVTPGSVTPSDDWSLVLKFTATSQAATPDERDAGYVTLGSVTSGPSFILTAKPHGAEAVTATPVDPNTTAGARNASVHISLVRA